MTPFSVILRLTRLTALRRLICFFGVLLLGKPIFAIASLTWKAAFRYRLFWVLTFLLVGAVVGLPLLLKDDGTAQGLTQILLTYTLSAIASLLGISTLWLSCGTLARDIEDCQMQVVSVKPIARWQIWVGKWIGIVGLNAALLTISGGAVFVLLNMRASQLPLDQREILKSEIFVARASVWPAVPDLNSEIEKRLSETVEKAKVDPQHIAEVRRQVAAAVRGEQEEVPSMQTHRWVLDLSAERERLHNQPLRARIKFHSVNPNANTAATYDTRWKVGPPGSAKLTRLDDQTLPAESFQELEIPPDLYDAEGKLTIDFFNANNCTLSFSLNDGLEVLYPEGSFGLNFIRGMGIILCWMALLATIGLAAASWLSFPVAAFFSLAVLFLGLSSGTLSSAIEQGTIMGLDHETGAPIQPAFDSVLMPVFKGILNVIELVESFSPVDSLSTGRSITWGQLGMAFSQIVLLMGGIFIIAGIVLFSKRELASVQGNS